MDNFTLLVILIILLGINVIFTFLISRNAGTLSSFEWRLSSVLLFAGFFLLLLQPNIPYFFSIIIANYMLLMGFYYQTSVVLSFKSKEPIRKKIHILALSILYAGSFLYFTYINFSTPFRIITISALLSIIYVYAVIQMKHYSKKKKQSTEAKELFFIFVLAALFYISRTIITAQGIGSVNSIFDFNISTSISFIFPMIFNLSFYLGMFSTSIQSKNELITIEKERFSHLFDFLNSTAKHLNLEELYPSIEKILKKSLKVNSAAIFLIDEDGENLTMAYLFDALDLPIDQVSSIKKGQGAAGKAIVEDRVIIIDIAAYPLKSVAEGYSAKGVTSMISAPIKSPGGIIGAITIVYTNSLKESEVFDKSFFYYLGEQVGLVLYNALLYEKVTRMANTDPLTGLFNRRKMQELFSMELKRAERTRNEFVLALADLDHFKKVNDNFSHECGDEVLKTAAEIFRTECRQSDYICRWGGEEFLFIFIESELSAAISVAERIRSIFENKKYSCLDNSSTTISIGLTKYKKGLTMEQLTALADEALYMAKNKGRNRIEVK